MEHKFKDRLSDCESRIHHLKKKKVEADSLMEQLVQSYMREHEILEEVLYYSKGTESQNHAYAQIEEMEYTLNQHKRAFEEGQKGLDDAIQSKTREYRMIEDEWEEVKRKELADAEN